MDSICKLDLTEFPFDKQICIVILDIDNEAVLEKPTSLTLLTDAFTYFIDENLEWVISKLTINSQNYDYYTINYNRFKLDSGQNTCRLI